MSVLGVNLFCLCEKLNFAVYDLVQDIEPTWPMITFLKFE